MRRIIAGLDVGSNELKLIVAEVLRGKINVLACIQTKAQGIKKGFVVNPESAIESFKELFAKGEEIIGLPIKKVIAVVPSLYGECSLKDGKINIDNEDHVVNNLSVVEVLKNITSNTFLDNKRLVTTLPVAFKIDDGQFISNPIGKIARVLEGKGMVITVPKRNIDSIYNILRKLDVELMDITISPLCDYEIFRNKDTDNSVGAIINIGEEKTTVSIFNKGVLTSFEDVDIGSSSIDKDFAYIYKISKKDCRFLKENLALATTTLAQPNESYVFINKDEENVKINQYDASEIVEARLNEILKLSKKQINLLTKKEISYIIVTGGITEIQDFELLLENNFGSRAIRGSINVIGARDNKYSSSLGLIKYYNERMNLRNIDVSIFTPDELEEFGGAKKLNISENSVLGKLFGYFFDN